MKAKKDEYFQERSEIFDKLLNILL